MLRIVALVGVSMMLASCVDEPSATQVAQPLSTPEVVAGAAAGLDGPVALAVASDAIYWIERTRVRSCPLPAGCATTPTTIGTGFGKPRAIVASGSELYFAACRACDDHEDVYKCPTSGCASPPSRLVSSFLHFDQLAVSSGRLYMRESSESVRGCALPGCSTLTRWGFSLFGAELTFMAADASALYVPGGSSLLRACDASVGCAAPTTLADTAGVAKPFAAYAGKAYWYLASADPSARRIMQCTLASCTDAAPLAVDDQVASQLVADATGAYWIDAPLNAIRRCALTGCPSGPETVAVVAAGASALTLGAGYVYWIEGNAILKAAKP